MRKVQIALVVVSLLMGVYIQHLWGINADLSSRLQEREQFTRQLYQEVFSGAVNGKLKPSPVGANIWHRIERGFTELYSAKVEHANDGYFRKTDEISATIAQFLNDDEKSGDQGRVKGHDFPRIPIIMDFKEWIEKYKLTEPKHLLTTSESKDPELYYLRPQKTSHYPFKPNLVDGKYFQGDLHYIPPTLNPANDFDLVVVSQTMEHLYDPMLALTNVFNVMVDGGYIFASCPSHNIPHMTPSHFFHYQPMGLAIILQNVGFEVVESGQWGNKAYWKFLGDGKWPDYYDMMGTAEKTTNSKDHPAQTWVLARKPLKSTFKT